MAQLAVCAMTNAVFTTSASSIYDDQPESRYHFPDTYLRAVEAALGDWIIYYEPRRTSGPGSNTGRSAYFAVAGVVRIEPDPIQPHHHYAFVSDYLEFDTPVPFRIGTEYFESGLVKKDGTTNKGAFGRAVRTVEKRDFDRIMSLGFAREMTAWELADRTMEGVSEPIPRATALQLVSRKFRDEAFRRHVRQAYANTCAVTGLQLTNGGGRPEVNAAHIRPVECDGPDTVRNGLALTATVHWMFDRGLISVDDSFRLIVSKQGLPGELGGLVQPGRLLRLPDRPDLRPHPAYLSWHRDNRFKV